MSAEVDIEKDLGGFSLNAAFRAGDEVLSLLGASGCGKSLTLRCIAGVEKPDRGRIIVDGVTLFDSEKKINLPPQKRSVGLMFQNYALFPHMTVLENIRTGAAREKNKDTRTQKIHEIMELFGLADLAGHYPSQLSGGQQQRTALARILVSAPSILLLDEPFSALDSHLRFQLERDMRRVISRFGKTVILVSHDRDEVFRLSDSIAVMEKGRIEAFGPRSEIFRNPRTREAAILTGCKNISRCRPLAENRIFAEDWNMELQLSPGTPVHPYTGIRMHDICPGDGENTFDCQVTEVIENPFSYTIMLTPAGAPGTVPVGWELDKKLWNSIEADTVRIHLPGSSILTLEEGSL